MLALVREAIDQYFHPVNEHMLKGNNRNTGKKKKARNIFKVKYSVKNLIQYDKGLIAFLRTFSQLRIPYLCPPSTTEELGHKLNFK